MDRRGTVARIVHTKNSLAIQLHDNYSQSETSKLYRVIYALEELGYIVAVLFAINSHEYVCLTAHQWKIVIVSGVF